MLKGGIFPDIFTHLQFHRNKGIQGSVQKKCDNREVPHLLFAGLESGRSRFDKSSLTTCSINQDRL